MISVGSGARFAAPFKSFFLTEIAARIGLAAFLCWAAPGIAMSQPVSPVYGTGTYTSPVYPGYQPSYNSPVTPQSPAYNSFYYTPGMSAAPAYNPGLYNAPLAPPPPSVYNAPWEGGGFYFGPTGSASFLQDSDLIKRIEPRTTDSLWSMPRSITGTSTNWASSSGSLRSGSDSWRGLSEGGSKTRVLSSSTGYNVGARAGYQFGNVRIEGEFDYANNSADTLENPRREISTDLFRRDDSLRGSTTGMTFLGNMIYDFSVPGLSGYGVTPHVLGGIGVGRISTDLKWGDRTIVNSSEWNFAYQLGAGVRYQVMPNWSLDLDYRYRGIIDTTLRNDFEKITVPYRSHNFVASLTWQLPPLWGVVAPATPYMPPPPPPPPPSRPGLPVM